MINPSSPPLKSTMPNSRSRLLVLFFCCIEAPTLASNLISNLLRETWRINDEESILSGVKYALKQRNVCFASYDFISAKHYTRQINYYSNVERGTKQTRQSKCYLSVPKPSRGMSNGLKTKKRKENANNPGNKTRMRKSELDDLVRGENALLIKQVLVFNHLSPNFIVHRDWACSRQVG